MLRHNRNSHEHRLTRRERATAAAVAGLAAGGLFLSGCGDDEGIGIKYNNGTTQSVDDYLEDYKPGDGKTRPADYGSNMTRAERDALPADDYVNLKESLRVGDQIDGFYKYLNSGYEKLLKIPESIGGLTEEERSILYMPDLNKPRAEWSDQDYLNYQTLAVWLITTQDTSTKKGMNEALQSVSVVAEPGTEAFDFITNWIKTKPVGVGISDVKRAEPSPLSDVELQAVTVGDVTIDNDGGRAVSFQTIGNSGSDHGVILFANRGDGHGKSMPIHSFNYSTIMHPNLQRLVQEYAQEK